MWIKSKELLWAAGAQRSTACFGTFQRNLRGCSLLLPTSPSLVQEAVWKRLLIDYLLHDMDITFIFPTLLVSMLLFPAFMKRAWAFPFMRNVAECVSAGVGLLVAGCGCSCCPPDADLQLTSLWSEAVFYVISTTEFLQSLVLLTSAHQFCLIMCFLVKNVWPAAWGVDMLYRFGLLTVIIQINPLNFLFSVYVCEDGVYVCVHV